MCKLRANVNVFFIFTLLNSSSPTSRRQSVKKGWDFFFNFIFYVSWHYTNLNTYICYCAIHSDMLPSEGRCGVFYIFYIII